MTKKKAASPRSQSKGLLKIGDQWSAITIIALSQSNPLKAIAEFVENSIDAKAKNIRVIRGREKGETYLKIIDDGEGVRRDESGIPDFKRVATHVCDSIKKQMKAKGQGVGLQGEFGIGLLSFWTVGEKLLMRSSSAEGKVYQLELNRGAPNYEISPSRVLFGGSGTEMIISPLLPGLRNLTGEKLQSYLSQELRNRILHSGVQVQIFDYVSRKEFKVEPAQFEGRRLQIPSEAIGHSLGGVEIRMNDASAENSLSLYRLGTRVALSIHEFEELNHEPWNSPLLNGLIDAPHLNLTPGTRLGVIKDSRWTDFLEALARLEPLVRQELFLERQLEEEKASKNTLNSIEKAFKSALQFLPHEEYDWFPLMGGAKVAGPSSAKGYALGTFDAEAVRIEEELALEAGSKAEEKSEAGVTAEIGTAAETAQKAFFEFAGPLHRVVITPRNLILSIESSRKLVARAFDKKNIPIEQGITFSWTLVDGNIQLNAEQGSAVAEVLTGSEPTLAGIRVSATEIQGDGSERTCECDITITVTSDVIKKANGALSREEKKGLPSYSFEFLPGKLERSRFDQLKNLIMINSGHRDFKFASSQSALKTKYICRLYMKELLLKNFVGLSAAESLERFVELSLYTEFGS